MGRTASTCTMRPPGRPPSQREPKEEPCQRDPISNLSTALRRRRGWARVGHLALGAVFLVTAILAFANLGTARDVLAVLIGVVVGFTWLVEGVVALALIADAPSKVWTVVYSVITIVAGAVLITSPLWGAAILWLLLGISLVVSGIVQLVRAFRFGSKAA